MPSASKWAEVRAAAMAHLSPQQRMQVERARAERILQRYDPDEPRDEFGRWTEGGGGGAAEGESKPVEAEPTRHELAMRLTGEHVMREHAKEKPNSRDVAVIAKELNDRAGDILEKAFGVRQITGPVPETDDFLADAIAQDLKGGLTNGHSSPTWYSDKMKEAMSIASVLHPELATDPDKRFAYIAMVAVNSQGEVVDSTVRMTEQGYKHFSETGQFPEHIRAGDPNIPANMAKLNNLVDKMGLAGTREFFSKEFTVRDLAQVTGYKVPKMLADDKVYGSAVLGPKVGLGFYQNLSGNFNPLTMDMWFMRAWGRMTNTGFHQPDMGPITDRLRNALKDEGRKAPKDMEALHKIAKDIFAQHEHDFAKYGAEYKSGERKKTELVHAAERFDASYGGKMVEMPQGGNQRAWMTSVFHQALDKLRAEHGVDLAPAGGQATWWHPEMVLYRHLGGRVKSVDSDYAKSLRNVAVREGKMKSAPQAKIDPFELKHAPWIEDPDEPERLTPAQLDRLAEGCAKLLAESRKHAS
jgi:hypothetical protein